MSIYVLHIDPPYRHARHYTGWTPERDPSRRISDHIERRANGSPLVRAALDAGCTVTVAHIWPRLGRDFERWLKTRRDHSKWCRLCGQNLRPLPAPKAISARFKSQKRRFPS